MPHLLVCMLWCFGSILEAATNCIPFPEPKQDQAGMAKLLVNMQSIFDVMPGKPQMRHATKSTNGAETANQLAKLPMAVPELPTSVASRSEVTSVLRGHVLADGMNKRILAFGQGGVGESFLQTVHTNVINLFFRQLISRKDYVVCHFAERRRRKKTVRSYRFHQHRPGCTNSVCGRSLRAHSCVLDT